jgi:hypothetical protein
MSEKLFGYYEKSTGKRIAQCRAITAEGANAYWSANFPMWKAPEGEWRPLSRETPTKDKIVIIH